MPRPRSPSGPNEPARSLDCTTQLERRIQATVRPDPLTRGAASGWLANEPANGNAGTRAKRAPPDETTVGPDVPEAQLVGPDRVDRHVAAGAAGFETHLS